MSLSRVRLVGGRRERVAPAAVAAVALAVAGLVVNVWRPVAPRLADVPTDLATFAPEVLDAVHRYGEPRIVAAGLGAALGLLVPLMVAATGLGRRLVARLAGSRERSPRRAALVAVVITLLTSVATLPLAVWIGYHHEGAWGFRTQGASGWMRDWLLATAVGWVIAAVAGWLLFAAIGRWPRSWPWRVTVLGTAVATVVVAVWPLVVQPLFLDTAPLPTGPIRDRVEEVLAASGEPDLPIAVGDASRRTTRVNAFVTGLGPSREVVLYDNLLELDADQVALVVGHELAHRQHHDIARGTLLTAAGLLPTLLALRWVLEGPGAVRLTRARGPADPRLVAIAAVVVAIAQLVGQPAAMWFSRRAEAAADAQAVATAAAPEALIATARIFTVRDLADPDPPTWVRVLYGSHPTVPARIRSAVATAHAEGLALPTLADLRARETDLAHPATR